MGMFQKAEEVKTALKFLVYGESGSGKTTFALSAPDICMIDAENGASLYRSNPNLKYILNTTSFSDVEEALDEIESELIDEIKTFVLDSETQIYNNLQFAMQNVAEKRARRKGGDVEDTAIDMRGWGKIKLLTKKLQSVEMMLSTKGINVITVAQQADIKEKKGDTFVVVGNRPDTAKGVEYAYDVVLRMFTEVDKKTGEVKYFAEVKKDRSGVHKRGQIIENPTIDNWDSVYTKTMSAKEFIIDNSKDVKKDTAKIEAEEVSASELVAEIKTFLKDATAEQKAVISKTMKSLELNIKDLTANPIEKLKEVYDLTQSF